MKKFSHLLITLIVAIFFTAPLTSVMAVGLCNAAAENDCAATGRACDPNTGACVPSSYVTSSGGININVIKPYSDSIIGIINNILVPVLMAIAFIVFLWGIYKYFIYGASNESDKAEGRKFAMWGIIGFVIILSVWGIVSIVTGAFGLRVGGSAPKPPIF